MTEHKWKHVSSNPSNWHKYVCTVCGIPTWCTGWKPDQTPKYLTDDIPEDCDESLVKAVLTS